MTLVLALLLLQGPNAEQLSAEALAKAQQGRIDEAEALWKRALAMDGKLFSANFNLGMALFQKGDAASAEPYLGRASSLQPKDFNSHYLHGAAASQLGKVDAAIRAWRAALALQPEHPKLLQLIAVEYGKGRYFREAADAAGRALRFAGNDANLHLLAIKAKQDAGDHPGALAAARAFHTLFPALSRAQFEYGFELYRAGRTGEALPLIQKATADGLYEEPFFFLGELHLREGRAAEAVNPLRTAISIRRDYMAAWCALARALMQMGELEKAKAELESAVLVNPKHPQPHLLLSQVYFRLGDEAKAAQEKALSLKLRREHAGALEALPGRPFPK